MACLISSLSGNRTPGSLSRPSTSASSLSNISAVSLRTGDDVLLSGLRRRNDHNGKLAKVQSSPDLNSQLVVKLQGTGDLLRCRANQAERQQRPKMPSPAKVAAVSSLLPSYLKEEPWVDLPAVPNSHPGFNRNPSGMIWYK
eukprot:TRINITY_DN23552_c0_g1_i1.p1 TRINITY_DN23552_c0_g1~~TRINITY_DN23552_c0_g1_i1.p1  ORF type:complete len:142 (-),score=21.39 TRINITY_DN23552_c0_g1_i1:30-455(-)